MIKRVLLVVKPFNLAGTERSAMNYAQFLIDKGIEVYLVTDYGTYAPYVPSQIKSFFVPVGKEQLDNKVVFEKTVLAVVRKYKLDLIHAHGRNALLCCQLARKKTNVPVIAHEHMGYSDEEYSFVANQLNNFSDKVIVVGPNTARKLIYNGLPRRKVKVVLNGIRTGDFPIISDEEKLRARNFFKLEQSDKVVLCLSRIVLGKEIDKLIDAFKIVLEKFPNVKLFIAGDDDKLITKKKILKQIKKENLTKKIFVYPAQYNIRLFHSIADIFCHPPIGKGMAVMEAMASGLPIIAKETFKKPFVVEDRIDGLLTRTTEPQELAKKMLYLLSKPRFSRTLGQNARKKIIENFDLTKSGNRILSVYNEFDLSLKSLLEPPFVENNEVSFV